MFTRKNKGGEVNKKTRKGGLQKGGGDWLASTEYINKNRQGVPNIGNTCYLCALYQLLFSIEEFAILIMNFKVSYSDSKKLPKILMDSKITTLFKLFTDAVKAKEKGKQSKYDFAKSVFIQEITFKFGPVDISELLCYLLSQIFSHISGTDKTNKLTYEPVMIPMILFPGQNPYGRQQDPSEAIQELIKYIPQLGQIIGFSQTENKYYKPSSEKKILEVLNKDTTTFESEYSSKKFSGKQEHNDILKIKPDIGKDESLQELIFKIGESDVGSEFPLTDMDEETKTKIALTEPDKHNNKIAFYTKEDYSDMKDYIIIYFPRTFTDGNGANEKRYDNLIDPNQILTFGGKKYDRCGIICHLGDTGRYGHYVYEDESYPTDKKEFNDGNKNRFMKSTTDKYPNNNKPDESYAMKKAWSMLLYKKQGSSSPNEINTKLIEMIDNDNWKFVFNNNIADMVLMLKTQPKLINSTYKDGGVEITALMRQAENGTPNVLQFLVEKGADVNQKDNSNLKRTALDYAISRRNVDNILYLLSVDKLNISENKESLIQKIKSSKLKKEDEDIIGVTIDSKQSTIVDSEEEGKVEEGKVEEGKLIDEKQTIFTSIIGNDYYKVPFFANYNSLIKDLMKVKSIKIGDKQIYYIKQYQPYGDDIVFLPHLWNFWKDELNSKLTPEKNSLTRKGELQVWNIEKEKVTQLYGSESIKHVMIKYNNDKNYIVHHGLMSEGTRVPSSDTYPKMIAVSFKWTKRDDNIEIDDDKYFDKNTFYGIYEFVHDSNDDNNKINPDLININQLLETNNEENIKVFFEELSDNSAPEYVEEYDLLKTYEIDDETAIKNIKLFANSAFGIDVSILNTQPIQKEIFNSTTSAQDDTLIESQTFSSDNIKDSLIKAANTSITSEPILISDNTLIDSYKTTIKSEPILISDNMKDSLKEGANVAMNFQKKSKNELILPSSINEIQSVQPSQSTQKQYTIQFDTDGKIKIVTDTIQTPGQSLSEEIEDQYFKGNEYYVPSKTKEYTVTVTKYQDGKIMLINI